MSRRPPVARIAVTEPPRDWFGGVSHAFYRRYRHALVGLGLEVFDVPVDAFVSYEDEGRCADIIGDLRAFRPELALGLPLGVHALVCRLPVDRHGVRPNLFTDVLDIPTICLWDHAPFELAEQLLTPHPSAPAQSTGGTLKRLQAELAHPRLIPWSRDSGQAALMRQFGLLSRAPLHEISPSFPDMTANAPPETVGDPSIAYIGTIQPQRPADHPPPLACLAEDAIARWLAKGGACWDALAHALADLTDEQRDALALAPDHTFFWAFAHRVILHEAQAAKRLSVLGAIDRPIAFYGKPHPGLPAHLQPMGIVPFGPALAAAYARYPIVVDVQNPGFIHGFGHKPIHAFAAGGFMLVDRKADFTAAFGDAGEAASYGSTEELTAKIDRFLGAPVYRREVGDAIRARIAERHSLPDVLTRIIEQAAATATTARYPAPTATTDLLPALRRYSLLSRTTLRRDDDDLAITTSPGKWTYAAIVGLPATRGARLEATMTVKAGRVDIGLLADDRSRLTAERVLAPSRYPATVAIELPDGRPNAVVLRNAHDGESQVRISALALREPPA